MVAQKALQVNVAQGEAGMTDEYSLIIRGIGPTGCQPAVIRIASSVKLSVVRQPQGRDLRGATRSTRPEDASFEAAGFRSASQPDKAPQQVVNLRYRCRIEFCASRRTVAGVNLPDVVRTSCKPNCYCR